MGGGREGVWGTGVLLTSKKNKTATSCHIKGRGAEIKRFSPAYLTFRGRFSKFCQVKGFSQEILAVCTQKKNGFTFAILLVNPDIIMYLHMKL